MEHIKNYINENKDRFINELIELLKIPSISADPEYKKDVLDCADAVAKALSKMKEVRFVSSLVGRHDLMAFVLAEDVTKLSKVLYEEISSLPGVRFSESSIGLKYYKYDYRWARILD